MNQYFLIYSLCFFCEHTKWTIRNIYVRLTKRNKMIHFDLPDKMNANMNFFSMSAFLVLYDSFKFLM